jgi:lysozyme
MMKNRAAAATFLTSAVLLATISAQVAKDEGFVGHAYRDVVGVWTIGYGETKGVKPGQTITREDAAKHLAYRLQNDFAKEMVKCIKVPITQNEYHAYLSFSYNVGTHAFCNSTIAKDLNAGRYKQACDGLLQWNRAGGKVFAGLTRRRQEERMICLGGADA